MNIAHLFESKSQGIEYTPHSKFNGVYLKHLVTGEMTGGKISCHLVKVEPFCSLDTHCHTQQLEIHEIIFGSGDCQIADRQIDYSPGVIEAIPQNIKHRVTAGKDGIFILAKFIPALL